MVDETEVEPQSGEPEVTPQTVNVPIAASTGPFAMGPYGDVAESTGPPQVIVYTPPYSNFLATDARSVMLTLLPNHYNLIPNPAFRTNGAGWIATGIYPLPSAQWRVEHAGVQAGLNAITAGTTSTTVSPNPLGSPAYVDGQVVKVVDTLISDTLIAWLKIDNTATLTVAQAAAVGITIASPVPKYRVFDMVNDALDTDSWVGRSLATNGTGMLRYRAGTDKFVYVGPLVGTQGNQWDSRRGGAEYTLSVYVKGAGDVRLTMDAYLPTNRSDLTSGPEYQNLVSTATPETYAKGQAAILDTNTGHVWTAITVPAEPTIAPFYEDIGRGPILATANGEWITTENDGNWHRVALKTRARVYSNEGLISFLGAHWIDTKIEIRSANNLKVSAIMLDTREFSSREYYDTYFDGGMTENLNLDDFLWEGTANNSPSYYYYDRVLRTKWLYERMGYVLPVGRPFQIFFGSYWRPYVGSTGETILMTPA